MRTCATCVQRIFSLILDEGPEAGREREFRTSNGGRLESRVEWKKKGQLERATATSIWGENTLMHSSVLPSTTPCWVSGLNSYKSLTKNETDSVSHASMLGRARPSGNESGWHPKHSDCCGCSKSRTLIFCSVLQPSIVFHAHTKGMSASSLPLRRGSSQHHSLRTGAWICPMLTITTKVKKAFPSALFFPCPRLPILCSLVHLRAGVATQKSKCPIHFPHVQHPASVCL